MNNNRFVFVMPAYNAESTIDQTFLSLMAQSYGNWKVIVRNDMSTDSTAEKLDWWFQKLTETTENGVFHKLEFENNVEKKWEVQNVVEMISQCSDTDIICRLDADDWLCDTDALHIINDVYNQTGVDAAWTAHRWGYTRNNISAPMSSGADPYKHPWVSSHLKTFRKKLLSDVDDKNFRGVDDQYFKRIGDQAVYLPALNQAKGNWAFIPIVAYHYTIDMSPRTFQTDDAKFQKSEAEYLRKRGFVK